jgi:hypothetical protein
MSITIEIDPAIEAALKAKADAAGVTLEKYAGLILVKEATPEQDSLHPKVQRLLEKLKPYRGKIGPIPDQALRPDLLYGDQ